MRRTTTPRDPKTPKQLAHRMKFSLVNKGLSPLNSAIKLGNRGDTTAYRTQVGKAYHEAIMGEYPNFTLDYSKIKIADGDLQLPVDIKIELDKKTNSALVTWDTQIVKEMGPAKDNDQANIVCYNTKFKFADQFLGVAKRIDGKVSITLPNEWKVAETNFWIYFSSQMLQMNSGSLYVFR